MLGQNEEFVVTVYKDINDKGEFKFLKIQF